MSTIADRASIPVTLPVSNPTVPLWQASPSDIAHYKSSSDLPERAGTVVIGSGITGASIAFEILAKKDPSRHVYTDMTPPGPAAVSTTTNEHAKGMTASPNGISDTLDAGSPASVVLLEARTACSGATGRNGGHTKCASYRSFQSNAQSLGTEAAVKIARFELSCMRAVHAFAREHSIECASWQGDTVDIIYDAPQLEAAKDAIAQMGRAMGPEDPASTYKIYEAAEVENKFGAIGSFGAVEYEAGSLSAYEFTIGVLQLAIARGLQLYTETAVTRLRKDEASNSWIVETHRGTIRADRVVLATNGYTAALYPRLQGILVPLRGQITAQRRGMAMPDPRPPRSYSFIQKDGYEYMIQRPLGSKFAGDVVIGGGLTLGAHRGAYEYGTVDDASDDKVIMDYLEQSTTTYFGRNWGADHPDGRVRMKWTGIMGYTPDQRPLVGRVPGDSGLFVAAGFQGHGMVMCLLVARALAGMLRSDGRELERINEWFPREFVVTEERLQGKFEGKLVQLVSSENDEEDGRDRDLKEVRHIG